MLKKSSQTIKEDKDKKPRKNILKKIFSSKDKSQDTKQAIEESK